MRYSLPVHCCCEPSRRLGTLTFLNNGEPRSGQWLRLVVAPEAYARAWAPDEPPDIIVPKHIHLQVCLLTLPGKEAGLAIKSMDYPIEDLRRLRGWAE